MFFLQIVKHKSHIHQKNNEKNPSFSLASLGKIKHPIIFWTPRVGQQTIFQLLVILEVDHLAGGRRGKGEVYRNQNVNGSRDSLITLRKFNIAPEKLPSQ